MDVELPSMGPLLLARFNCGYGVDKPLHSLFSVGYTYAVEVGAWMWNYLPWGHFYLQGLTVIMAWISHCIYCFLWDIYLRCWSWGMDAELPSQGPLLLARFNCGYGVDKPLYSLFSVGYTYAVEVGAWMWNYLPWGHFYLQGLTVVMAWINHCIRCFLWDILTLLKLGHGCGTTFHGATFTCKV